jgi:hypothetical protein
MFCFRAHVKRKKSLRSFRPPRGSSLSGLS